MDSESRIENLEFSIDETREMIKNKMNFIQELRNLLEQNRDEEIKRDTEMMINSIETKIVWLQEIEGQDIQALDILRG